MASLVFLRVSNIRIGPVWPGNSEREKRGGEGDLPAVARILNRNPAPHLVSFSRRSILGCVVGEILVRGSCLGFRSFLYSISLGGGGWGDEILWLASDSFQMRSGLRLFWLWFHLSYSSLIPVRAGIFRATRDVAETCSEYRTPPLICGVLPRYFGCFFVLFEYYFFWWSDAFMFLSKLVNPEKI